MADTLAGAPAPPAQSGLKIPMSAAEAGAWQARLEAAVKAADAKKKEWEPYITSYMVRCAGKAAAGDHEISVPLTYAYVELKKSQLRFQVPEVNLKPKRPEWAAASRAFEGALNHELGESGADAMLDMVSTDVLVCGIAAAKVGYFADIRTREVPVMAPPTDVYGQPMLQDPLTGAPTEPVQQLDPVTREPLTQDEDWIAHECFYNDRIAPENLLIAADFTGGDYDRASYLGHRFQIDVPTAIRRYGLPADFQPTATKPMDTLSSGETGDGRDALTTKDVEGIEVFYLATVFHEAIEPEDAAAPPAEPPHVGQYRRLVFIKGKPEPVVHEDSPYQYIDEADGKLKGMTGNPLHVLTLRYLPGSAYPVSDVQAGFPAAEEVNIGRSQMVNFRDRIMPQIGVDRTKASPELKAQLEANANAKLGRLVLTDAPPNEVIQSISVAQFPRDNFKFNEVAQDDFRLAWSMGKHAAGMTEDGEPITATEVQAAQTATDTRLAYEQTRFLKWWCKLAEKFGANLQQFKDEPGYAEILGEDGAKALQAWNRTGGDGIASIKGEFVFSARPDAALRLDVNADRQQKTQLYTQLGNDPNVNRVELLKPVLTAYGLDPAKIVVEQLPEKGPEPPRISWSFKGEDLSPVDPKTGQPNAAFPLVLAIAQQGGIQFDQAAIENAMQMAKTLMASAQAALMLQPPAAPGAGPTEHPGATTPMQPISKHVADRTAAGGTNLVN
jgi:hypothetical protein